jgi:hypothetical protein
MDPPGISSHESRERRIRLFKKPIVDESFRNPKGKKFISTIFHCFVLREKTRIFVFAEIN